jgi:hypothetical protein
MHHDGGFLGQHRQVCAARRVVKAACEDTDFGGPIRADKYGFANRQGPFYHPTSNLKTVLTALCGRRNAKLAAQAAARNAKLAAAAAKNNPVNSVVTKANAVCNLVAKNASINCKTTSVGNVSAKNITIGKNVPKNATLLFKTFPVGTQTPVSKDTTKLAPMHTFTLLGTSIKGQPKVNLKRLSGESFKENDIVKSARKTNTTELFTRPSQQTGHVVAVSYSNSGKVSSDIGGTSLLRTSERVEHSPGESLLVNNRSGVGLLTARTLSVGDTLPQLPAGMSHNNVTAATADKPQESHRGNKAKGTFFIIIYNLMTIMSSKEQPTGVSQ